MVLTLIAVDTEKKKQEQVYSAHDMPVFTPLVGDSIECFGGKTAKVNKRTFRFSPQGDITLFVEVEIKLTREERLARSKALVT